MALSHKVALYVPSKVGTVKVPDLHRFFVKTALTKLGLLFGGATLVKGVGTWVGADGKLVMERVGICYSFTDAATLAGSKAAVFDLARLIAGEMSQEAVAVEVDGTLHFVKADVAVEASAA